MIIPTIDLIYDGNEFIVVFEDFEPERIYKGRVSNKLPFYI